MYEVLVYDGSEWKVVFRSVEWGPANLEKWRLIDIHGWNYVEMTYAPIV